MTNEELIQMAQAVINPGEIASGLDLIFIEINTISKMRRFRRILVRFNSFKIKRLQ